MLAENSVAVVTGAGTGIGKAAAVAFARAGALVCVADVDLASAEAAAEEISQIGKVMARRCDVSNETDVMALMSGVRRDWGRLDYAFNNAGIRGAVEGAHEMSEAAFRRVHDVNVVGVFLCQREALKVMYEAGRGAIVNMASTNGFVTTNGAAHYTSSKHAVVGLTKAAAFEAAPRGVRVNAVAPGTVETRLNIELAGSEDAMRERYVPSYPIGRLGRAEEVAEAVVWLCEDRASFVTGHALVLDGGLLLR